MKSSCKILIIIQALFLSSCAMMFNDKNVNISVNSSPKGADIVIEGRYYGKTPATISIEPKNYTIVLNKEGYGMAEIQLESLPTIRNKKGDAERCIADMVGTPLIVPYYSFYYSGKCLDFKQNQYFINIPYAGNRKAAVLKVEAGKDSSVTPSDTQKNKVNNKAP